MHKILIIEDNDVEMAKAIEAAKSKGLDYEACNPLNQRTNLNAADQETEHWSDLITDVSGIVTDLFWTHFPPRPGPPIENTPSGLLVMLHAMTFRIPLVICTDSRNFGHGHHGNELGWIYDGYIRKVWTHHEPPFNWSWEEEKNWSRAIDLLLDRIKKDR